MIKYEEQVPLHHLVTVMEGRISFGWRPISLFVFEKMYTIVFEKDEAELLPQTNKVERWQWVFKNRSNTWTSDTWRTKDDAINWAAFNQYKFIGKDPNCLIPLLTEDEK